MMKCLMAIFITVRAYTTNKIVHLISNAYMPDLYRAIQHVSNNGTQFVKCLLRGCSSTYLHTVCLEVV